MVCGEEKVVRQFRENIDFYLEIAIPRLDEWGVAWVLENEDEKGENEIAER